MQMVIRLQAQQKMGSGTSQDTLGVLSILFGTIQIRIYVYKKIELMTVGNHVCYPSDKGRIRRIWDSYAFSWALSIAASFFVTCIVFNFMTMCIYRSMQGTSHMINLRMAVLCEVCQSFQIIFSRVNRNCYCPKIYNFEIMF